MDMPAPTEAPAPPQPEQKRVSRKGLYVPLALLFAVIALWSGIWVYARGKAGELMDAWMAREARVGRQWTCPDRSISGFPFRIDVICSKPTFVSSEPRRTGQGALDRLAVTARILDPKQIIAVFNGPLTFKAENGDMVELAFADARASYRGTPGTLDQASIDLTKPVVTLTAAAMQPVKFASAKAELHIRRAPVAEPATDIALSATEIQSEALNAALADSSPAAINFRTQLTKFAPAPIRDWRQTLETWRQADGEAKIDQLTITKGGMNLGVTGVLRLDSQRRPEGELNGSATGANQLLRAFGIELGGGGGLLGSLLGNKPGSTPKALPFALRMDGGRLFVGPIPGPRLRPLYSN